VNGRVDIMAVRTFKRSAAEPGGLIYVDCWMLDSPARCHAGTISQASCSQDMCWPPRPAGGTSMHGIIYLIGLIVVLMAILSFLGLR
jgi:hypothetical protein